MRASLPFLLALQVVAASSLALAQAPDVSVPKTVEAGAAFSIQCAGNGKATLFIVGPGQVLKQDVQLGESAAFPAGSLYNAGWYTAIVTSTSGTQSASFDVLPQSKPSDVSFLARPSRLPVGIHNAITGAVYVFDSYRNLISAPEEVQFDLSNPAGAVEKKSVTTHDGAAWTEMDSTAQQGSDKFAVHAGSVSSERIVAQVPGDPCGLKMSAKPDGQRIQLTTEPVRDCNGNAVPDGTIVTFTENFRGTQSTVDVPLKRGIAEVQMPAHPGATISVASGVVMGNQIGWQ
ncbi:MAG TPA: hypothetical protein VGG45_20680 [Terracidiphilus sp.]